MKEDMKEELTTLMHMEFARDEQERLELAAHGVFDAVYVHKELKFDDALKVYGITEAEFWDNPPYKHVLSFPYRTLENLRKDWSSFSQEEYDRYKSCKTKHEIYEVFVSYWD